jgi:hypothetical protein
VGREPTFWTDLNLRIIRDYCVAVSVSNFDQNREDAVGAFVRRAGMKFPGAGGSRWFVTADGKGLGGDPLKALREFQRIPASERAPGAVQVEEMGEVDTRNAAPEPPPRALILRAYYRAFMHDGNGGLRYVTGRDLWHDEKGAKAEASAGSRGDVPTSQAQPDHVWLTEAEWKSLVPAAPREGDTFPMPAALGDRFIRWHLNPLLVYGESNPLDRRAVRGGELTLTVIRARPSGVRLRLDGFARLGEEVPGGLGESGRACLDQWGYGPRVLGYLEYDLRRGKFARFDVVALGEQFGRLGICDSAARPGYQPVGISFELVEGDRPADRIAPGRTPPSRNYFQAAR